MVAADTTTPGGHRSRRRGLLLALLLVLASAGLLVGAIVYAGGLSNVLAAFDVPKLPFVRGSREASKSMALAGSTTAAAAPEYARRMYVQQLQSEANIARLAAGELDSLLARKVTVRNGLARVDLVATFQDGTYGDGIMILAKSDGGWYLSTLTGVRSGDTGGFADTVNDAKSAEDSLSAEDGLAALGMRTFDDGVISTLVDQQGKNQPVLEGIVEGRYESMRFGEPERGLSAITVPTVFAVKGGRDQAGRVTLIEKRIDGRKRLFIASFVSD